jgi:DNA-binding response OmpR family regulator
METKSLSILLIEDDKFLRKAAEATLHRHGFRVSIAINGEEGLKLAQSSAPDLILLDLIMPKMNGFEVLRALKREPATSSIPVIVLSNLGQQNDSTMARALGALDYWVKANVGLEELVERVKAVLAGGIVS